MIFISIRIEIKMASNQININSRANDAFYRYKMPTAQIKIEGNFTVIVNFAKICASLNRPCSYILKFIGSRLGTLTMTKNDKYIINGIKSVQEIQSLIFEYIDLYILCQTCENPETVLIPLKSRLSQKCRACGTTNIFQKDKTVDATFKEMTKKTEKRKIKPEIVEPMEIDDDDQDWLDDTSPEAVKARAKEFQSLFQHN